MDLAWLRDSNQKTAIIAKVWQPEPAAAGICFYAPRFYRHDSQTPWLWGEPIDWPTATDMPLPAVVARTSPDPQSFDIVHAEILNGIRDRRFSKVVPFVGEEIEFAQQLDWQMCPSALSDPGSQFAYGFQFEGEGMWGITPEILFRVENGVLHTMALAGTAPVGGPSLLENSKERLEHQIVVDHISEALAGLGGISIDATREQNYPFLKHLLTPIRVKLNDEPVFIDLVSRLHPTAALGGQPRAAAMDFLRVRGGDRVRFGAPFGFVNGSQMLCTVAIRSLQWSGQKAQLMSGCGVVDGSVAGHEWNELSLKRRSTARQLGLEL